MFRRRSEDGGLSFGHPTSIAAVTGDTPLGLPVLAARPNGDVAVSNRRTRTDVFSIGDYVSLDARSERLAAASVLPRPGGTPAGGAAVYVTTLAEPPR